MDTLYTKLEKALKTDPRFVDADGDLFKNEVIDKAYKADQKLIEILLSDKELEQKFFSKIKNHSVFNINDFVAYVQDKNFLNDSYTKFKNKIGLNIDGKFLNERKEVALVWPFKDCVLEGGMTKEDQKRKEIFFNEILAHDDIDKLFAPKVLTNWKRYTKNGEEVVKDLKRDSNGTIRENLIIKGNNLVALHTLKTQFQGKVKLIYIDPPYNTGSDSFGYNDNFNHSTWLTFMKNRLEIAKELLREDGAMFVQCDDVEQAYLRILMDEVFGRENFVNLITVKTKIAGVSGSSEGGSYQDNCEYINFYSKSKNNFELTNVIYEKIELFSFIQKMKENDQSWKYTTVIEEMDTGIYIKSIKAQDGSEIKIFKHEKYKFTSINEIAKKKYNGDLKQAYYNEIGNIFRTTNAQSSIRQRIIDEDLNDDLVSIEYMPTKGKNKGKKIKLYYKDKIRNLITKLADVTEVVDGAVYKLEKKGTLWDNIGYNNISKEGEVSLENGKKPEEIIYNILYSTTNEGDIVLDFHLGSGTTAAVAHKMNRQYLGMEQIDVQMNLVIERLNNVIKGDPSGVSKNTNWKGGGDFVYCELMKYNEDFIDQIESAKDTKVLFKIWGQMKEKAFFKYNVDLKEFDASIEEFKKLDIEKQKEILVSLLNKNQMYVNLSEIDDNGFKVEKGDKELNKKFYERAA